MKENTFVKLRRTLGITGGVLILAGCLSGLQVRAAEHNTVAVFTEPRRSLASTTLEARKGVTATVTADTLNVRSGPGSHYPQVGLLTRGYQVEVIETSGNWSRVDGGWVYSKYLTSSQNHGISKGDTVVITAATLNVRQGAGTDYARVDHLNKGARVEILDVKDGWGKIRQGWISLKYASRVGESTNNNNSSDDGVIHAHKGDVAYVTADKLNIRTGPGTEYPKTGALTNGYRVEIIETKGSWARTEDGWISLKYLNIKSPENVQVDQGDIVRVTADILNVRTGPGSHYARVGQIVGGSTEEILEVRNGWGKIKEGWISLNYVSYIKGGTNTVIQAGDTVKVTADWLNVRQGAGTDYARVDHLTRGATVRITEIKDGWGKFDKGWISLNYAAKV